MYCPEPIHRCPENAWYVFAYQRSDTLALAEITNFYDYQMSNIKHDPDLTTSEREEALMELLDQRQLTAAWYTWEFCDRSAWFQDLEQAMRYFEQVSQDPNVLKSDLLGPEEFQRAMAAEPWDMRVYWLKRYLLKMRDADPPMFKITAKGFK